jgi:uncharacterized integral membrane protein
MELIIDLLLGVGVVILLLISFLVFTILNNRNSTMRFVFSTFQRLIGVQDADSCGKSSL